MPTMTVEVDTARAILGLRRVETALRRALRRMVTEVQREFRRELVRRAPVETGALKRSIRVRRVRSGRRGVYVLAAQMRFYGLILNASDRTQWHGWADLAAEAIRDSPRLRARFRELVQEELRRALGRQ